MPKKSVRDIGASGAATRLGCGRVSLASSHEMGQCDFFSGRKKGKRSKIAGCIASDRRIAAYLQRFPCHRCSMRAHEELGACVEAAERIRKQRARLAQEQSYLVASYLVELFRHGRLTERQLPCLSCSNSFSNSILSHLHYLIPSCLVPFYPVATNHDPTQFVCACRAQCRLKAGQTF